MKRKDYLTPATQVVQLRHEAALLAGSPNASVNVSLEDEDWEITSGSRQEMTDVLNAEMLFEE